MQTDASRRKMYAKMGLAAPIPSVDVLRSYCFIDDRVPPEGESDGEFNSHNTWVHKAASWIGWTGAKCFDAKDRPCRNGGDMKRAQDENAFPVRWYWPERFALPIVPNKADRIAIKRLTAEPMTIADYRSVDRIRHYKVERLHAFFNENEIALNGDTVALTPAGIERQAWWKYAMLCADCVRRP